jgi:hypothetical protein
MSFVLASVVDIVQIAHELGYPHYDPPPKSGGGGGAGVVVILIAIAVSILAVAGLIWLKRRTDA